MTARTDALTALVHSGLMHNQAERILRALDDAGLAVHHTRWLGAHPDVVDRDGDRWRETSPGRWWMVRAGDDDLEAGRNEHQPSRGDLERNVGPLIEVPRHRDAQWTAEVAS